MTWPPSGVVHDELSTVRTVTVKATFDRTWAGASMTGAALSPGSIVPMTR
jgi:hypothetical protein